MRVNFCKKNLNTRLSNRMILLGILFFSHEGRALSDQIREHRDKINLMSVYNGLHKNIIRIVKNTGWDFNELVLIWFDVLSALGFRMCPERRAERDL